MKRSIINLFMVFVCLLLPQLVWTQDNAASGPVEISNTQYKEILAERRKQALDILGKEDTTVVSAYWPNVDHSLFFTNVRNNILHPDKINQGKSTNFCGYAALTHLLLRYHPELYIKYILSLYHDGKASLSKRELEPSKEILEAAGKLVNKGMLDVLHADQLWFLTLADGFKGYMNIVDHHFDMGDENKIWAATTYSKFNKMLADFTDNELRRKGSDLMRPKVRSYFDYIQGQLHDGVVILYVNSKHLYQHKFSFAKLRAPTHFIVAYNLYRVGDMVEFQYWDYGLRTEQQMTQKRFDKLIFGVTTIERNQDARR